MIRFLPLALLLSVPCFALPPIEGGRNAPLDTFDYVDVVKMTLPGQKECTATRVSPVMVLTAAHCVPDLSAGNFLSGVGKIVKVTVHPKYAEAKKQKTLTPKDAKARALATLFDVAFIELEEKPSKRTMPYPSIISATTKFAATRNKMGLAGFGMNEAYWNGDAYDYRSTKTSLQVADNNWEECPLDYFGNEVAALSKFNKEVKEHLSIKATRVHTIANGQETISVNNEGMVLPGDSGSPSIERDVNDKFIVTGVASNIIAFGDESGEAELEIVVDGNVLTKKKLENFPDNWGLRTKSNTEFTEIQTILKEKGLLDDIGQPKAGVVVKRKYTRVSEGNYSDLSHPENQKFIKAMMQK